MSLSPNANKLLNAFKYNNAATLLASVSVRDSVPRFNGLPEVVVAGRANVGKSTFLNALLNRTDLAATGKKAGRTRTLGFYRVGRDQGGLILVDAPGYGARGRSEWGTLWDRYVDNRQELRAILLLINAPHGITDYDRAMLEELNERLSARASGSSTRGEAMHVPILQPIFTKIDRFPRGKGDAERASEEIVQGVKKAAPIAESPIMCAIVSTIGLQIGIPAAREAICRACAEE